MEQKSSLLTTELYDLCSEIIIQCPFLDNWMLWKYLKDFEHPPMKISDEPYSEIPRELTKFESEVLTELKRMRGLRKSMPAPVFEKLFPFPWGIMDAFFTTNDLEFAQKLALQTIGK